jgi:transcriptional regulator with XRE-family HTH domain
MTRLKEWREQRGLTVRGLAAISGVHYVSLVRIEMGRLDPRLSTLQKLCAALGVSLSELVGDQPLTKGGRHGG